MARDWEATFSAWATPPGTTEGDRIENAIRAVRRALDNDPKLSSVTRVYPQGSYRNRVNVRQDSDVDLGVLFTPETLFGVQYPEGVSHRDVGNVPSTYNYSGFKDDVEQALVEEFGHVAVRRGPKAFDIHENTYRLDADVVPTIVHRRYDRSGSYICGVELWPDTGGRIINWPERLFDDPHWPQQHYEHAVSKNTATGRCFKGVVRILKTLRNEMEDKGVESARHINGFSIECLAWNVPDGRFGRTTWDLDVQAALAFLWTSLLDSKVCAEWGEVSELKYMFKGDDQKRQKAYNFVNDAWDYIGVRT